MSDSNLFPPPSASGTPLEVKADLCTKATEIMRRQSRTWFTSPWPGDKPRFKISWQVITRHIEHLRMCGKHHPGGGHTKLRLRSAGAIHHA